MKNKNEEVIVIGCSKYPETILKINKNINREEVLLIVASHGIIKTFDNKITEKQLYGMLLETKSKFKLNSSSLEEIDSYIRIANKLRNDKWVYNSLAEDCANDFAIGRIIR